MSEEKTLPHWLTNPSQNQQLAELAHEIFTYEHVLYEITGKHLDLQLKLPPAFLSPTVLNNYCMIYMVMPLRLEPLRLRSLIMKMLSQRLPKSDKEVLVRTELLQIYTEKICTVVIKRLQAMTEHEIKDDVIHLSIARNLTKLKENLLEFQKIVDRFLFYHMVNSLCFNIKTDLSMLEDINHVNHNICLLRQTLKEKELWSAFMGHELKINEEEIVCSVLGLSDRYTQLLSDFEPELLMHQDALYYITKLIEETEATMKADGYIVQPGIKGLIDCLQKLGFHEGAVKMITESIPGNLVNLQLPSYWAIRYMDHVIHHHPLFYDSPLYPVHTRDEWFQFQVPPVKLSDSFDEENTQLCGVSEINTPEEYEVQQCGGMSNNDCQFVRTIIISSNEAKGAAIVQEFLDQQQSDQYKLLYHGTTYRSVLSLLTDGVNPRRGSKAQDFSCSDGFYLTSDYQKAAAWSKAGRGNCQAIVVYKISNTLLAANDNGLDLTLDESLWENVIRCCRDCYTDRKVKKIVKGCCFIQGPPCTTPVQNIKNSEHLQGFGEEHYDICIRDDDFAEEFGNIKNIACVIFSC